MTDLQELFDAREGAERILADAKITLREANDRLRRAGLDAFMAGLAAKGITEGSRIVIDGAWSGGWADRVRSLQHDHRPVILRGVSVDSVPWTDPPKNSTCDRWWFRLTIARINKNGTTIDEYRHALVTGKTPEDAAREVAAFTEMEAPK